MIYMESMPSYQNNQELCLFLGLPTDIEITEDTTYYDILEFCFEHCRNLYPEDFIEMIKISNKSDDFTKKTIEDLKFTIAMQLDYCNYKDIYAKQVKNKGISKDYYSSLFQFYDNHLKKSSRAENIKKHLPISSTPSTFYRQYKTLKKLNPHVTKLFTNKKNIFKWQQWYFLYSIVNVYSSPTPYLNTLETRYKYSTMTNFINDFYDFIKKIEPKSKIAYHLIERTYNYELIKDICTTSKKLNLKINELDTFIASFTLFPNTLSRSFYTDIMLTLYDIYKKTGQTNISYYGRFGQTESFIFDEKLSYRIYNKIYNLIVHISKITLPTLTKYSWYILQYIEQNYSESYTRIINQLRASDAQSGLSEKKDTFNDFKTFNIISPIISNFYYEYIQDTRSLFPIDLFELEIAQIRKKIISRVIKNEFGDILQILS